MSCLNALHWQLVTLLSAPHEIVFLQHDVFREYAKITIGHDFIHTLPSFIILAAAMLLFWRNPPSSERFLKVGATLLHKAFQVFISWFVINVILWIWLIIQRMVYCGVWYYWSYVMMQGSEYQYVSYPWWQRIWSRYYPINIPTTMVSASFISWILTMSIAINVFGYVIYTNYVQDLIRATWAKVRDTFKLAKRYMKWPFSKQQQTVTTELEPNQIDNNENDSVDDESEELVDTNRSQAREDIHRVSCVREDWEPQPNNTISQQSLMHKNMEPEKFMPVNNGYLTNGVTNKIKFQRYQRGSYIVTSDTSN